MITKKKKKKKKKKTKPFSKLTDEGALGRNDVCVVDGGLETGAGALCKGSAGVAGFDISHALLTKETC